MGIIGNVARSVLGGSAARARGTRGRGYGARRSYGGRGYGTRGRTPARRGAASGGGLLSMATRMLAGRRRSF